MPFRSADGRSTPSETAMHVACHVVTKVRHVRWKAERWESTRTGTTATGTTGSASQITQLMSRRVLHPWISDDTRSLSHPVPVASSSCWTATYKLHEVSHARASIPR
eukprot:scaffold57_cov254-Pinguiococcus_pyrenoidosus.AAC.25